IAAVAAGREGCGASGLLDDQRSSLQMRLTAHAIGKRGYKGTTAQLDQIACANDPAERCRVSANINGAHVECGRQRHQTCAVDIAGALERSAVKRHSTGAGAQGSVVADAHYAAVNFSAAGVTVSHLQHQRSISGLGKLSAAVDRST